MSRLEQGENEFVSLSHKCNKSGGKSVQSKMSSLGKSKASQLPAIVEQKQLEFKEAEERLLQMEQEQKEQQKELQNVAGELQLTKQCTEQARKVAKLNKSRVEQAERLLVENNADTVKNVLADHDLENKLPLKEATGRPIGARILAPIKLKGVHTPNFLAKIKLTTNRGKLRLCPWFTSKIYRSVRRCAGYKAVFREGTNNDKGLGIFGSSVRES